MKKLLALVLALVMTMGLAAVSTNAAYSDAKDISLSEAVDVMSAVGVFQGSNGKFSPKENLNREQAAKLIAYLDLGEKTAEALPAVKAFSDVPATSWAAKYVAYCADAGYIAGDGSGKFLPTGELTGYAFGKMVLCALGYDANIEGFTGGSWTISVAKKMQDNDIADGLDTPASAVLTREQAALYCLNALKATMVEYEDKGSSIKVNGAEITTGAKKYNEVANKGDNKIENDGLMQLGEKRFSKLSMNDKDEDKLGRPATTWTFDGEDVCTVAQEADASYTGTVKSSQVYKDLEKKAYGTDKIEYYENGVKKNAPTDIAKSNDTKFGATNALVEFFLLKDSDDEVTGVCAVMAQYKFSTVNKVNAEKTDKNGDVTKRNIKLEDDSSYSYETESFAKDDKVIYALGVDEDGKTTIADVRLAKTIEGKVTAAKSDKLTVGGKSYENISDAKLGSNGTFYLGVDDSIVSFKGAKNISDDYAAIYMIRSEDSKANSDGLGDNLTYTAYVVLADGTKKSYVIASEEKDGKNVFEDTDVEIKKGAQFTVVCYEINSDGELELASPDNTDYLTANNSTFGKNTNTVGGKYASANTKFVFINVDNDKNTVKTTVTTGYKNVAEDTKNIAVVYDEDDKAITVFVESKPASDKTKDNVAVLLNSDYTTTESEDGKDTFYNFSVAIDGKETTLLTKKLAEAQKVPTYAGAIFTYETDGDYFTDAEEIKLTPAEIDYVGENYIAVGENTYDLNKDCKVYAIDGDMDEVEVSTATLKAEDYAVFYIGSDVGSTDKDEKDEVFGIYVWTDDYKDEREPK